VVILTAAEGEETQHQAEHLAVKYYIRKPVNFDKFLQVVKALKLHWRKDLILPSLD
jgi:DNA-binding response OmpR family regulator